ncbi:hypothetical protein PGB90_006838 [Kerria lacca]
METFKIYYSMKLKRLLTNMENKLTNLCKKMTYLEEVINGIHKTLHIFIAEK